MNSTLPIRTRPIPPPLELLPWTETSTRSTWTLALRSEVTEESASSASTVSPWTFLPEIPSSCSYRSSASVYSCESYDPFDDKWPQIPLASAGGPESHKSTTVHRHRIPRRCCNKLQKKHLDPGTSTKRRKLRGLKWELLGVRRRTTPLRASMLVEEAGKPKSHPQIDKRLHDVKKSAPPVPFLSLGPTAKSSQNISKPLMFVMPQTICTSAGCRRKPAFPAQPKLSSPLRSLENPVVIGGLNTKGGGEM